MIIPTTGTHWCYEIVAMLRNNSPELTKQSPPLIDRLPVEKLRQVSDGLRVSHLLPRHMPRDSIERRCKIIHIYRNPKDVAVSDFNLLKKTKEGELIKDMEFDVFFQMCITDQYTINCLSLIEKEREKGFNCWHILYIFSTIYLQGKKIQVDFVLFVRVGWAFLIFLVSMWFKEKRYS